MKIRKYLTILTGLLICTSLGAEEQNRKPAFDPVTLTSEIRNFWPDGNCAENISGDKRYVQISLACNGDYPAHLRTSLLDAIQKNGWNLIKENYRIDPRSTNYFYKFEIQNRKLYVKLFLRNPKITWPLHENKRPKIAIMLNNVKTADDLLPWTYIKLPLSISIPVLDADFKVVAQKALELNYDPWVLFSGTIDAGFENSADLDRLTSTLNQIPEESFYFSGLLLPTESKYHSDTQNMRAIIKAMKKSGLTKFLGPPTLEIIDTSRVLGINSLTATFRISEKNNSKDSWKMAFEHAKEHGYAVIILDAGDTEARNILLNSIQDTLNYIDYVNLTRLPISENPLNGKQ